MCVARVQQRESPCVRGVPHQLADKSMLSDLLSSPHNFVRTGAAVNSGPWNAMQPATAKQDALAHCPSSSSTLAFFAGNDKACIVRAAQHSQTFTLPPANIAASRDELRRIVRARAKVTQTRASTVSNHFTAEQQLIRMRSRPASAHNSSRYRTTAQLLPMGPMESLKEFPVGRDNPPLDGKQVSGACAGRSHLDVRTHLDSEQTQATHAEKPLEERCLPFTAVDTSSSGYGNINLDAAKNGTSPRGKHGRSKVSKPPAVVPQNELLRFGYLSLGPIAAGVFSKVVRARHVQSKRDVAVKTFLLRSRAGKGPPPFESVKMEIECLEQLKAKDHPNVANLLETHEGQYEVHIMLQYCSGGSLQRYLQTLGHGHGMEEEAAARLLEQLSSALSLMHRIGVVHRDVKPGNVVFTDNSRQSIRIVDFGFATIFRVNGGSMCKKLKTICGSPAYMAPELIRGTPYLGPPVDSWAFGCLAYELLHNRVPFRAESMPTLHARILKGSFEKFSASISRRLVAVLKKLLVVEAPDRLSTAAATKTISSMYNGGSSPDGGEPERETHVSDGL